MEVNPLWPKHIGIIMDGNGRWAQQRGHQRFWGHMMGAKVAKNIIEDCRRIGVKTLTLYTFSTENWRRPDTEVKFLMRLLKRHLARERKSLVENNIRFTVIGELGQIPQEAINEINLTIEATKNNDGMDLIFALSYGGRQEITDACKRIADQVQSGKLKSEDINEGLFSEYLQTSQFTDPELIIRTSGERRMSNFLLWQSAYSEIFFCKTLWPDFDRSELIRAFDDYSQRNRRFGGVESKDKPATGALA